MTTSNFDVSNFLVTNVDLPFPSSEMEDKFEISGKVDFSLDLSTHISENYSKAFKLWYRRGKAGYFLTRAKLRAEIKFHTDEFNQKTTIDYIDRYTTTEDFKELMVVIEEYYNAEMKECIKAYVMQELKLYKEEYIERTQIKVWKDEVKYFKSSLKKYDTFENPRVETLFKKYKVYEYDKLVVDYIREKYKELYNLKLNTVKTKPIICTMTDFNNLIFAKIIIPKIKIELIYSDTYFFKSGHKWISCTLNSKLSEIKNVIKSELINLEGADLKLLQIFTEKLDTENYLNNFLSRNKFCSLINVRSSETPDFKDPETYGNFINQHFIITKNVEDTVNKSFTFETFKQIYKLDINAVSSIERYFYVHLSEKLGNLIFLDQKNKQCYIGCKFFY